MTGADAPDPTVIDPLVAAAHAGLHADAVALLRAWRAPDHGQSALREAFLGLLAARPDGTARACVPGHLTASCVVLSADRTSVLLTLHPRLGRWVQLGGHCEPTDASLYAAAVRETAEESGIPGCVLDPRPVHLDVHPLTCSLGVPTRHFDVRFLGVAPAGAVPAISTESDDLRFFPLDGLPDGVDEELRATIDAAVRGASSAGDGREP